MVAAELPRLPGPRWLQQRGRVARVLLVILGIQPALVRTVRRSSCRTTAVLVVLRLPAEEEGARRRIGGSVRLTAEPLGEEIRSSRIVWAAYELRNAGNVGHAAVLVLRAPSLRTKMVNVRGGVAPASAVAVLIALTLRLVIYLGHEVPMQ